MLGIAPRRRHERTRAPGFPRSGLRVGALGPIGVAVVFVVLLLTLAEPSPAVGATSPLGFAEFAVSWSDLDVHADSLHLDEIARNEQRRDSLRVALASGLAAWVEAGATGWDELPAPASRWVGDRVREGFLLADPRWDRFAVATASRPDLAGLLRLLDAGGEWTLPGALYLLSRKEPRAAKRWLSAGAWPGKDAPFLAILAVESRRMSGDGAGAAAVADSLLARGNWPDWTREPLAEARIEALLALDRLSEAGPLLRDYGRAFAQGPWFFGTSENMARRLGHLAEADSLAWVLSRRYPGGTRAREWLEAQVPLDRPLPPLDRDQLEILLGVAEETRGLTRFLLLEEEIATRAERAGGPAARRSEKERLDLRAAELAYRARRYEDLFDALRSGRIAPSAPRMSQWGLVLGRTYRNTGEPDSMGIWFDQTVRKGTADDRNTALWEWGRELESLRRFEEAEEAFARMLALGAGDRVEDVHIRIGFVRFQQKRYVEAEDALAQVVSSATGWRVATAEFWRYRCRLARGDAAGARDALERAARAPDGYYAARARSALSMEPEVALGDVPGYWREVALLAELPALGEIPFRADMASDVVDAPPGLPASLTEEAERLWLFRQYGRETWAARALDALDADGALGSGDDRIARLHDLGFPDLAARRVIRSNLSEPELRYPAPYGAAVAAAAERGGLAPEWIWAVMRRESFFEATVRSPAGATGLMQFMKGTAELVGERNGLPSTPLTSPVVNLALGIAHLRELVDETGGDWPRILAGYNAGMHNAVRWVHPDDDPDVFIEMIGFRETRDYVKAVLEGFWIYRETLRVSGIDTVVTEAPDGSRGGIPVGSRTPVPDVGDATSPPSGSEP